MNTFVDALRAALPTARILAGDDDLSRYAHDDAEWAVFGTPAAVLIAATIEEVSVAVRTAAAHRVAVIARGAGTGLSGGANATDGSLVISLEAMTAILEVNVDERYAIVQAGVLNDDLRTVVARAGLWYPPDPASMAISTIGGNVATN